MEKSQNAFLAEIRDTLEALKGQIAEIEAKLADFEAIEQQFEDLPEDLPEETSLDPIDISIDVDAFADFPSAPAAADTLATEPAPVAVEPEPAAASEAIASEPEVTQEPIVAAEPEVANPEPEAQVEVAAEPEGDMTAEPESMPAPAAAPEPQPAADPQPEPDVREMSLEDVFGKPPESVNDRLERKARKTVAEAMGQKCYWRTAIPGSPVKNIISAISLNDRVLFINTLFKEDAMAFQQTISAFNSMETLPEAEAYIAEHYSAWNLDSDVVYRLMMAVRRKLR